MVRKKLLHFALLFFLAPSSAVAAAGDVQGTRSLAMGGSLRAAPGGSAAPLINPSAMSMAKMYVVGTTYQYRGSDSASLLNATVVDSITSRVAAGLYYTYISAKPKQTIAQAGKSFELEESLTTHEVGLAMSLPIGSALLLGVTAKYINRKGELPTNAPASMTTADISRLSVDVGGTIRLGKSFSVAVVGYNLAKVGDQTYPRSLGLGAAFVTPSVLLNFDSVLDFSSDPDQVRASFHGGGELFIARHYALRAGVMHNTLRQSTFVSGGIALISRRVGLDFSVRQMVDGGGETMVGFSLQAFMQ